MSKHVGEKCGKLCISGIQSSKRGITQTNIPKHRKRWIIRQSWKYLKAIIYNTLLIEWYVRKQDQKNKKFNLRACTSGSSA